MNLLERLQHEFGDAVTTRAAGDSDAVDGGMPRAVAAPRDEAAACDLLAWCGREKLAGIARGGGTKIEIGASPVRFDVLISTEYLNHVIEHDEGNATVTAEAGVPLEVLDEEVSRRGQFVPLEGAEISDEVRAARATLGGVVATNHSGASKLKYGAPRDLVVGLHAALSDGRLVKAGAKVVKNVSGYDLNKLFIGSFGTLGLITQVTLRLRPHDAVRQTRHMACGSWQEATGISQEILDGPFEPIMLRVCANAQGLWLRASFAGGETAVQSQIERLPGTAWHEYSAGNSGADQRQGKTNVQVRAALPLQSAAAWVQKARREGASSIVWDYGTGVVHACFDKVPDVGALREEAVGSGGFVIVERAPAALKTPDFVWGVPRSDFILMQRLKAKFDPAAICAPGRFVGGLE
jgi:glycolate oxidase FAD binding subunit